MALRRAGTLFLSRDLWLAALCSIASATVFTVGAFALGCMAVPGYSVVIRRIVKVSRVEILNINRFVESSGLHFR